MKQIVVYFTNGRMVRLPEDKIVYVHLGQSTDEEYKPDTTDQKAVINWDNVAFTREWIDAEDEE